MRFFSEENYENISFLSFFFENVGIRTVVFGPGQHDQCHIANEYILLEKLEKHIEILQSFIKKIQEIY